MKPLIKLENFSKTYHTGEVDVHAVRGVSLEVADTSRHLLAEIGIGGQPGNQRQQLGVVVGYALREPQRRGTHLLRVVERA